MSAYPDEFANFRRISEAGGAAKLLSRLAKGGLDPEALPAAAALVALLDWEASARAEARRIKSRRANEARWARERAA